MLKPVRTKPVRKNPYAQNPYVKTRMHKTRTYKTRMSIKLYSQTGMSNQIHKAIYKT